MLYIRNYEEAREAFRQWLLDYRGIYDLDRLEDEHRFLTSFGDFDLAKGDSTALMRLFRDYDDFLYFETCDDVNDDCIEYQDYIF